MALGSDTRAEFTSLFSLYEWVMVVTAAIVFGVVLFAVVRYRHRPGRTASDRTEANVAVTVFKWGWRFTYARAGVTVVGDDVRPPTIHVPVGVPIVFVQRSRDVVHSFWVPALRFKRDVWPDQATQFELTVKREGVYAGRCAEFCGLHHTDMNFTVVAENRDRFERWLAAR